MNHWIEEENALCKKFVFKDFKEAMLFMNKVALFAEEQNHHPWWSNVYNKVEIKLTTHDAGNTVSDKDRRLAQAIDEIELGS